ncbi:MAG: 16S rRNA (adenine(1518)-N(6)/adenine(1519)-N(6))-dimethyltransferase RsmA [Candidatus Palauibacterales bacterium]|nr:16S rRNA (adenine(1518)-N(6)/adenine(1519)-N(6))-dimethyltransferase RsmA [Candidatus Palauibacterales bacterium]MDP2483293.1 16S rRNA (adenine(1518)-N(6)/adenine(1519)-N(6))-dimethyltransferase RsmA [Candidatus Palauibacterales bacterium]
MVRAKRSLSQNFLVDPNIRRKIVEELGAGPEDSVLEVGPGHGELSDLLAGRVGRLALVEKDDGLAAELALRFGGRDDVRVVHGDALDVDLAGLLEDRSGLLVSNVPYGITSPLVFRFLEMRPLPRRMVLLVQKEVAERIAAPAGSKVYGALTVGVQARADVRIAFRVGRRAFRPVPAVDSAVLVIDPHGAARGPDRFAGLRILTRVTFSRRRKQLGTILRGAPEYALSASVVDDVLRALDISPRARPETLSPGQFVELAQRLEEVGGVGTPGSGEPS